MKRPEYDLSDIIGKPTPWRIQQEVAIREKAMRKRKKITQKQMASLSGVSYASFKRFEQTGKISFPKLLNIALILDCLDEFDHLFRKKHYNSIQEAIDDAE